MIITMRKKKSCLATIHSQKAYSAEGSSQNFVSTSQSFHTECNAQYHDKFMVDQQKIHQITARLFQILF